MEVELKPEDLRIGNLFNPSQPVQVEAWMLLPESNVVFEPIPLTEEWLEKFSFKHNKVAYKIDNENFVFELYFYDAWNLNYVEKSNFGNGNVELSGYWTVHQLQNLYFALTGEELTLTETPCTEKE